MQGWGWPPNVEQAMTYQAQRRCDCGCRRPAVVFLLIQDLAFASLCIERVPEDLLWVGAAYTPATRSVAKT